MRILAPTFIVAFILAACGPSAVTNMLPLSYDTMQITTAANHKCGVHGAQNVAFKQAAVATIGRGFDRFVILNSVGGSNTVGAVPVGGMAVAVQRHQNVMVIRMFKDGEPEGDDAIIARGVLGSDWASIVKKGGPTDC